MIRHWKYYWCVGPGQINGVTAKQKMCYDFVRKYYIETGKSPTYKEIGEYCDCRTTNVLVLIKPLVRAKLLDRLDENFQNLIPHDYYLRIKKYEAQSKDKIS